MSVLFPQVKKPRDWDFRPRYYDPEKEKQQKWRDRYEQRLREKQAEKQAEEEAAKANSGDNAAVEGKGVSEVAADAQTKQYMPSLHRGSFREAREHSEDFKAKQNKTSRLVFWLAALALVVLILWLLK